MTKFDNACPRCIGSGEIGDGPCVHCEGYGYLLTAEGVALVGFLKRRGVAIPMSPADDTELSEMIEP